MARAATHFLRGPCTSSVLYTLDLFNARVALCDIMPPNSSADPRCGAPGWPKKRQHAVVEQLGGKVAAVVGGVEGTGAGEHGEVGKAEPKYPCGVFVLIGEELIGGVNILI